MGEKIEKVRFFALKRAAVPIIPPEQWSCLRLCAGVLPWWPSVPAQLTARNGGLTQRQQIRRWPWPGRGAVQSGCGPERTVMLTQTSPLRCWHEAQTKVIVSEMIHTGEYLENPQQKSLRQRGEGGGELGDSGAGRVGSSVPVISLA